MALRIPRVAVWLSLGAVAALAGGCAGKTASATDAPGTRAEARVFAREVNLRLSDLPGFEVGLNLGEGSAGPLDSRIEKCDGGPIVTGSVHEVASPIFQTKHSPVQTVLSTIYLMSSPSTAASYIRAANAPRGLSCIQSDRLRSSPPQARIEVYDLHSPLGDAPVLGMRLQRCFVRFHDCGEKQARGGEDRLWFATGPYVVGLGFVAGASNAPRPRQSLWPIERRLIALLYRRATAFKAQ